MYCVYRVNVWWKRINITNLPLSKLISQYPIRNHVQLISLEQVKAFDANGKSNWRSLKSYVFSPRRTSNQQKFSIVP